MEINEKKFILELKSIGFIYKDIFNLPIWDEFLDPTVINCILKWLPLCLKENLANGTRMCNSLLAAREPFDPYTLIEIFERNEYSSGVLSTIAISLAEGNTYDISEWIKNELLNKPYDFKRTALLNAVTIKLGIKRKEDCITFLKQVFDKYHEVPYYITLFKYFANTDSDISYLESKLINIEKKENKKQIIKLIKNIKERKKEQSWMRIHESNNYIPKWLKKVKTPC